MTNKTRIERSAEVQKLIDTANKRWGNTASRPTATDAVKCTISGMEFEQSPADRFERSAVVRVALELLEHRPWPVTEHAAKHILSYINQLEASTPQSDAGDDADPAFELLDIIAQIREVTGVGDKPMLDELPAAIAEVMGKQPPADAVECAKQIEGYFDGFDLEAGEFDAVVAIIDTALAQARLEGAKAMQEAQKELKVTPSENMGMFYAAWMLGVLDEKKVSQALDPQQVINESIKR